MRIFALELNNDIKGIAQRKEYIESLIASLPSPDFVVLPELALCSYMASKEIWQYADDCGTDTSAWAMKMSEKYHAFIGVGYLDKENGDYYNRYLIADGSKIFGVAICYDAKRKHFYENVKNEELSLILFPHGCPADPEKPEAEQKTNDFFCGAYEAVFHVPVVYANSKGRLEHMPGKMGQMMAKAGFAMNGYSKIYYPSGAAVACSVAEAVGADIAISPQKRQSDIHFYGDDITRGNWFFRQFVLKPDTKAGIRAYERNKQC